MRSLAVALALGALVTAGCGGAPASGPRIDRDRIDRNADDTTGTLRGEGKAGGAGARSGAGEVARTPIRNGVLRSRAVGASVGEASRRAKAEVAAQIRSRVRSRLQADSAVDRTELRQTVRERISQEAEFEHGELIHVVETGGEGGEWWAEAVLDADGARRVYRAELQDALDRLASIGDVVEEALKAGDTSVLLATRHAPSHLMAEAREKAEVLAIVGETAAISKSAPERARRIERKAAAARAESTLRVSVRGKAPAPLRKAAVGEVTRLLQARGCRVADGAVKSSGPVAKVGIELHVRDHTERGAKWRYVGLEVEARDAKSGRPIFSYSGMPQVAHGGGMSWDQADEAAARALTEKLPQKAGAAFRAITCR
jgi:hypothetical protein